MKQKRTSLCKRGMCTNYIIENIDDEELKKLFARIRIQQKELSYKDEFYNSIQKEYELRLFLTTDGDYFVAEVFKKRRPNQDEVDGASFFVEKGYSVIFLSEAGEGQHPDMLIDGVLVEIKTVRSRIANSISNRVKQAVNKEHTEIPVIFLIEDGINSKYEDIQKSIESRKKHENFKREYELIIFVKERVTTVIKNMPGGSIEPA